MKKSILRKIFLGSLLILIGSLFTTTLRAQVINEGFEEAGWTTGAGTSQTTYTVNAAGTASINNGNWAANCASVNTAAASSITGSHYFYIGGSSSGYLITPLISSGVAQVTVKVRSATGTQASLVIGFATNLTVTANTGSLSSTAGGNAWSLNSSCYQNMPPSNTTAYSVLTFIVTHTASTNPGYIKIQRVTTGSLIIDDIIVTPAVSCTNPTLSGASQAATVCTGSSATINLTGMVANSTANAIDYTINGTAQTQVTGIAANGSGAASFTTRSLTFADNGLPIVITKITNGGCNQTFSVSGGNLAVSAASSGGTATNNGAAVCAGNQPSGTVTLASITGTVTKWQKSTVSDFSSAVTDIANTTTTLNPSDVGAMAVTTYVRAVVTNSPCASANSNIVTLTVNPTTSISSQSTAGASYGQGYATPTALTVTALGAGLSYQWYSSTDAATNTPVNDIAVGTNSNSYTPSTAALGTLYYYCVVSGTCGSSVTSTISGGIVIVSSCTAPTFSAQPTDGQSVCINDAVTLGTVAADQTPTYQWYSNTSKSNTGGTSVGSSSGGNTATYTPPTGTAGIYYYYCVATSGACPTPSNAVQITVNVATGISSQSTAGASYTVGASATALTVTGAGADLTYEWYSSTDASNSTPGDDIIVGTNSSSFTPPTTVLGTLYYYCIVYGTCSPGQATSAVSGAIVVSAVSSPTDYFRSVANGNWGATATWESSADGATFWVAATSVPTSSAKGIEIKTGTTVTVAASLTTPAPTVVTDIKVNGTLAVSSTFTLTLGSDMTINSGGNLTLAGATPGSLVTTGKVLTVLGTITNGSTVNNAITSSAATLLFATSGGAGTFTLTGTATQVPTATWVNGTNYSTINITNSANTTLAIPAITLGNVVINTSAGTLKPFANSGVSMHDLTVTSTGTGNVQMTSGTPRTVTVTGNYLQTGGIFNIMPFTSSASAILNVTGNVSVNGGTLTTSTSTFATSTGYLNIGGNLSVAGGATLSQSSVGTGTVTFNGGSAQTINNAGSITGAVNFTINNGAGVSLNSALTINGTLTLTTPGAGNNNLTLGNYDLTLAAANAVAGTPGVNNHIVNSGSGKVIVNIASVTPYTFPVGPDASHYAPVTITNTIGTAQTYTIGAAATTYSPAASAVWDWSIASSGTNASTIVFGWATADAGATLSGSLASASAYIYNGSVWTEQSNVIYTAGTPNLTTVTGVIDFSSTKWTVAISSCTQPVFSTQPSDNLSECMGGTTTLGTVLASQTPSYQWYSNSSLSNTGGTTVGIANGGNTDTYTPPSGTAGAYYYYVVASKGLCKTTSNPVTFTVNAAPTVTFTAADALVFANNNGTYTTQGGMTNYVWTVSGIPVTDYTIVSGGSTTDNTIVINWVTAATRTVSVNYNGANGCAAVTPTVQSVTVSADIASPVLTPASPATVDNPFVITFPDNPTWWGTSPVVKVGTNVLPAGAFSFSNGTLTLTPSASAYLQTAGTYTITVTVVGYTDATVSQAIGVGAANKLAVTQQPTAPATNGGVLAQQPKVTVQDKYGNTISGSTASITATTSGGTWIMTGTATLNAVSGVATFSGLTAGTANLSKLSTATITFASAGLTSVVSSPVFVIPGINVYYWNGSGTFTTPGSWYTNRDGTGTAAANFTTNTDVFIVQGTGATTNGLGTGSSNQSATVAGTVTFGAASSLVKLEVEGGATLQANAAITISSSSPSVFILDNGGLYIHNVASDGRSDIFAGTTILGTTSTVQFNQLTSPGGTKGPWGATSGTSAFGNVSFNIASGTLSLAGKLLKTYGNMKLMSTNACTIDFHSTSTNIAIGGNLEVTGGILQNSSSSATETVTIGGNFLIDGGTFDPTSSTSTTGATFVVAGYFNCSSGSWNPSTKGAWTMFVNGDFLISGGNFYYFNGAPSSGGVTNISIGGNFNMTSGVFNCQHTSQVSTVNFNFYGGSTPNVQFIQSGGTFTTSTGAGVGINWGINSGKTVTYTSPFTIPSGLTLADSGVVVLKAAITKTGNFNVVNGAELQLYKDATVTGSVSGAPVYNATSSKLTYIGTSAITSGNEFPAVTGPVNVTINNAAGVSLSGSRTITGVLTFTSGTLSLGTSNLTIPATASSIVGVPSFGSAGSNNYILTNGTGSLIRTGVTSALGNVLFPVGSSTSYYNPVQLNNSATTADFTVSVNGTNLPGGGGPYTTKNTWAVSPSVAGSNVTMSLQWNAGEEDASFVRTACGLTQTDGSNITNTPVYSAASGSGPYIQTLTGITSFPTYWGCASAGPVITVTPGTLTFGSVVVGNNSTQQSYSVSGTNLTGDVVIGAPSGFQISLTSGSGYTTSLSLPSTGGILNSTTIYVIFSPAAASGSTGNLNITNTNATVTKNVVVTGIAIATDPGTTAPTLACGSPTTSSVTLTMGAGSSSNTIIMATTNPALLALPAFYPVNGTTYTDGGNVYGSGSVIMAGSYVVYNGTGTSATITGLTPNTTYYFAAVTYNMGTNNSQNYYNTSTGNCSSATLDASVNTDYFRSITTGNWTDITTWQSSHDSSTWITATLFPTSTAKAASIRNSDVVTVNAAVTAAINTNITTGAKLVISSGTFTTTGSVLTVNGTLENAVANTTAPIVSTAATIVFNSTGIFILSAASTTGDAQIPTSTWNTGSTCKITGIVGATGADFNGLKDVKQTFSNFIVDDAALLGKLVLTNNGALTAPMFGVAGDFTVNNLGTGSLQFTKSGTQQDVTIGGNYVQNAGTVQIVSATSTNATRNLNVTGNFTLNGTSIFNIIGASGGIATNAANLNISGNLVMATTATLTKTSTGAATVASIGTLKFTGASPQTASFGIVSNVNAGAGPSTGVLNIAVTGAGGVTLNSDLTAPSTFAFTAATLNINGHTLEINNATWGSGTLTTSASSNLTVNGTAGTFHFTGAAGILKDLKLNAGATATISASESLDITAGSAAGSVTIASGATLTTNDKLTLKSDANGTARVGISAGSISGKVTIERYLPMIATNSGRRWRLMGIPVSATGAPTINASWQEGAVNTSVASPINPNPSYGTEITNGIGTVNNGLGFDAGTTASPSIYKMEPGTGAWTPPASTNGFPITNYQGYMLFARGDRSIVISNQYIGTTGGTNLRIKGNVNMGNNVDVSIVAGKQILSNPYPSAISFNGLNYNGVTPGTTTGSTYYLWDPKLIGSKSVGGFVTFSSAGNSTYTYVPYTGDNTGLSTYGNTGIIESGGAFMINSAGSGTFTFHESDKLATSSSIGIASRPMNNDIAELYTNLLYRDANDSAILADGVATTFGAAYHNEVDAQDALKMQSFQTKEKIGLLRGDSLLAIERRHPIMLGDTIFLQMLKLDYNYTYQLQFIGKNFSSGLSAVLIDKYLDSTYTISTDGVTIHNFKTVSNPASMDINRFKVVFRLVSGSPLPVRFTDVAAWQHAGTNHVEVTWKTAEETATKIYTVERSLDGIHFTAEGSITANGSGSYNWTDNNAAGGMNYYRVASTDNNDTRLYSKIVNVKIGATVQPSVAMHSNPVTDGVVAVQLAGQPSGKYSFRVLNSLGQMILQKESEIPAGNTSLNIGTLTVKGIYHLEIIHPDNTKTTLKFVNQ